VQLTSVARVFVLVALVAPFARADTSFVSKVQVYADSDHTTVVSPVVSAASDVARDTNVSLGYLADVVTSASIDVVTQASKTTIHDTRHQVTIGGSHTFDTLMVRAGYLFSKENDYLSHTFNAGVEKELDDKTTTLGIGYNLSLNTVGRSGDENFSRSIDVHSISAAWTQVINERTIAQISYELGYESGYQASPYRFVPIRASLDAAPELWVPETDPDSRWRQAAVAGINRAVGDASSVQADYRFYYDDYSYSDFAPLTSRTGTNVGLGVTVKY